MMRDFFTALGLVFVLEGLAYAISPRKMQEAMRTALAAPAQHLRTAGLLGIALGVFIVWLTRG